MYACRLARHGVRARAFACGRCNGVLTSRSISSGAADACQRKHVSPNVGHALACAAARELRRPGLRSGLVPAVSEVPLRMLPKAFAATRYGSRGSCGRACPDNIAIGRRLWAPANWPPPLHKVGSTRAYLVTSGPAIPANETAAALLLHRKKPGLERRIVHVKQNERRLHRPGWAMSKRKSALMIQSVLSGRMWGLKVSACVWRGYSVLWTRRMGDYSCCCVLVKFAALMNARQLVCGTTDEVIAGCAMREDFPRTASRSSTCLPRLHVERLDKQARHVPPPREHNGGRPQAPLGNFAVGLPRGPIARLYSSLRGCVKNTHAGSLIL